MRKKKHQQVEFHLHPYYGLEFLEPRLFLSTTVQLISNPSFDNGAQGWQLSGDLYAGTNLPNARTSPGYAAGGVDSTGGQKNFANGSLIQQFVIPNDATTTTLRYYLNVTSQETTISTLFDELKVKLQNAGGQDLATIGAFSNLNKGTVGIYQEQSFDLSGFRGQTVRVSFVATSDSSNPTVFRIDDVTVQASIPTPPATPTGLIASDNAFPDKVLLTWNSVAGATGYQVWRGTSSNPATASFLSDASLNLFQDFNATSGQTYFYFVSATNADGASGLSAGNSGSRAIPQPPLANTGTAQPNGETTALLFGTVNPQGSTTTAWFEWGTTTSYGFMTNPEVIGNGSSVVQVTHGIQGLTPGATYNFRIMGSNGTGTTAGSNLSFTMPAPPVVKPTVTTGDAINITTNTASLEGIVNPNGAPMKSYFEWGPTAAYGNVTESRSYGGTGTSGIDFSEIISGLSPGTPYHYRVVATNSAGTAVGLDQALVTDGTNPVAPSTFAPGNLALPGQVISTATPLFAWQSVVGALEFGLYVSKRQPNGTYSLVFDSDALDLNIPGSATTFTLPNGILVNGGEYRWNMNIRDANGWRNVYSERRYFTFTTGQAPVAPGSLTAVAVDHHTAQLGWPVVPQATGYRVYRALASDGPWTTEVAFTTSNAATDYELDAQTRYYYAVAAVNSAGSSPLSPVASITTPAAPAIPLSPTALTVTLTDQLNVQMSWVGAVPNETYVIERAINGGSFVPLASISGTTSYLDTSHANSTPQTTYGYRVAAVADGVRSAVSVVAEVTRSLTSSVIDAVTRAVLPLLPVSRDGVAKVYRWKYDLDPQAKVASDNAAGLWELVTDLSTLNLGTKKNILLTHGWNDRLDLYGPEASNEFMTIFASDYMDGRLPSEWNNTNILAIDWGQAGALGSDPNGSPELWDEVIKGFAFGAAVGVTVGLITGGPGGAVVGGIKRGLSGAVKSAWKDAVLSSSNGIAAAIPLARRLFDAGIDLSKTTAIGHSNGAGFMASLAITLQLLQPSAEKKLKELVALDAPWPTFAHGAVVNAAPFVEHLTNYYTPSIETNLSDGIEINVSVGAAIIGSNVTNFKLSDDRPVFNLFRDEIASGIQHSLIPIRYANTADRGNPEGRGPIFATEYPWGYASSFFESGVNSFDEALIWVEDSTGLFRPELTLGDLAGELFDQTKWVLDKTTNLIRSGTKRVLDAVDSGANFVLSGVNTIGRKAGDAAAGFFAWIDGQANSPVLATVTTGVPDDATFLRFDLAVADVGNNDTLLVAVGDQVIGQVDLAVHKHAGNGTVELWVGDYAGMNDVELSFFMPSETASSAEFTIGNVEYLMLVTEATDTNSPFPISETFFLHSNPGASKRIFLDFDGHVTAGTLWNSQYTNGAAIVSPAYSSEGDGSFSVNELTDIQRIWQRTAEDFLPFNVDVTTEDPGVAALIKNGNGDTEWGIRVVITSEAPPWSPGLNSGQSGGSFNSTNDTPAFVWINTPYVGTLISHEVGHSLGLSHDGTVSPPAEYYPGHGTGATSWGSIMGGSGGRAINQWSRGEYSSANNQQDDLAVITTENGFDYRVDDHGSTFTSADNLNVISGTTISSQGIIERNTDVDVFVFSVIGGPINIQISPGVIDPNLDILAELFDSSYNLLSSSNPIDLLSASFLNQNLEPGLYYLQVRGTGKGDPLVGGYTNYGSLGSYAITGTGAFHTAPTNITLSNATVAENAVGVNIGVVTVIDPDFGDTHDFAVSDNRFEVVGGQLKLKSEVFLDFESEQSVSLEITATDQHGLSKTQHFNITVTNVNDPVPEVEVQGNGVVIVDGDTTPSTGDHTDFGSVIQGGTAVSRTFTVRNDGNATLTLAGLAINGQALSSGGFTRTNGMSASLAPGESDTFQFRLDASVLGTKNARVTFLTNDSDEDVFSFNITGKVVAPEVNVFGGEEAIASNLSIAQTNSFRHFGTMTQGNTPTSRTFTVRNEGEGVLNLSNLTLTGGGFTVTNALPQNIQPGSSANLIIQLDDSFGGTKNATVSFTTNDTNENPFTFKITGKVVAPEVNMFGAGNVAVPSNQSIATPGSVRHFGTAIQGDTPVTRTFTVRNDGTATLTLRGLFITGSGFTITNGLPSTLAPGTSHDFTVRMDDATGGTKAAQVSFLNNDSNENPFKFLIAGKVLAPEVNVFGTGNVAISSNLSIPQPGDVRHYGKQVLNSGTMTRTFTVRNDGTSTLTLSNLSIVSSAFTLTKLFSFSSLAPGQSDTMNVRFSTASLGLKSATISFNTNDANESPFTFKLLGEVVAVI